MKISRSTYLALSVDSRVTNLVLAMGGGGREEGGRRRGGGEEGVNLLK